MAEILTFPQGKPFAAHFELVRCGLSGCRCHSSAYTVQIEGECSGLRITESSNSVWYTVARIEPGDPRYRDCLSYLQGETEGPHAEDAQRYQAALPSISEEDLAKLETQWLEQWAAQPLYNLMQHARYRLHSRIDRDHLALERLERAGFKTCGDVLRYKRTELVKAHAGIGVETGWAIHNAFASQKLNWDKMRDAC